MRPYLMAYQTVLLPLFSCGIHCNQVSKAFVPRPDREDFSMPITSQAWHLARRPHGEPVADDFELVEHELPGPGSGEVLVRNTWLSMDPYMRGRMNDAKSYVAPF